MNLLISFSGNHLGYLTPKTVKTPDYKFQECHHIQVLPNSPKPEVFSLLCTLDMPECSNAWHFCLKNDINN